MSLSLFGLPVGAGSIAAPNGKLQLHFLNVGQGDAALVVTPQGQVVMVDNGVANSCDSPVNYLQSVGVLGIEAHIASHYHADHIGCTEQVMSFAPLAMAGVDRGGSYSTQTYQRYTNAVGSKRMTAVPGATVPLDSGVLLDFVAANGAGVAGANDENDMSVVMRLRFGQFDAVFAGDLSGSSEAGYADVESVVAPLVGPVEVYKVNHHGSRYSSNANWLSSTRPRIGVVSVGSNNPYGHPAAETMGRLHAAGVRTFWTSVGKGVAAVPGLDTVAGNIVVEVEPGASTFTVRYAGNTETFPFLDSVVAPPDAPTGLSGSVAGATVSMAWSPAASGSTPIGYVVEAALTAGGPVVASLPTSSSSVVVPGVPNGTYFIRVRAQNSDGVSAPSNEISLTVGPAVCGAAPSAPGTLTGSVSGPTVSLAWGPSSGGCPATGYTVRAGTSPGAPTLVSLPVGATTNLQVIAPPGTYYVAVSAENAFGGSALSNEVQVTVGPSCTIPGPPGAFSVGSSGTNASLTWAPPTTGGVPTGYVIEAGTTSGSYNLGTVPVAGTSLVAPVPPGTYYLRVRAQNACGAGAPTAEQVLTMACVAPAAPGAPSASVSGSTANVAWAPVAGATAYRLDVGTAAGAANVFSQVISGTSRQIPGLANGTYFMRLAVVNGCGTGPVSGEAMFAVSVVSSPTCGGAGVPTSVSCGAPSARCNDGTYSCSRNRSGTCSSHGGVSCWVCPGPLC